jgi:fructosamine-3-kinase
MPALPLANQVRQLYVASTLKTDATPSQLGDLRVLGEEGKFLYFQHFGQGGLTASDKIDVCNIRYIKQTAAAEMRDMLKNHTIKVTEVSAGQVYEIKVLVHNYIGLGALDYTYRFGLYKAKKTDDAAAIAAGLAADLQAALGLEKGADATVPANYKEQLMTVTVSGDTITISEVEQFWQLAKFPVSQCPLEIYLNGIVTDDEYLTYEWAEVGEDEPTEVENEGKKIADLEYFTHGWRGDIYRNVGWPRTIDTAYMVNPASSYDLIDIHYFYQGTGVSVQQSEKEITLVVPAGNSTILAAIEDLMGENKIVAPETFTREEGE